MGGRRKVVGHIKLKREENRGRGMWWDKEVTIGEETIDKIWGMVRKK